MIPQTPWFERQFHFDFPAGIFPIIFSRLEGSIFRLYSLLSNADDELCSFNPNGWSVKEHVGHLYDLEELWWKRLQDFQQNKAVLTSADLNNQKTRDARHNEKTLEKLQLILTRALHQPKKRKATKPTKAMIAARLASKKMQSAKKENRKRNFDD